MFEIVKTTIEIEFNISQTGMHNEVFFHIFFYEQK